MTGASDRFWAKVATSDSGCLLWTASRNAKGYGVFGHGLAHRWSYTDANGPVPEGLQLDHLCRVRHCVNPRHLEAVTPQVNSLRGRGVAAKRAAATECESGHKFAGANLYIDPAGYRRCRTCVARWQREYRARRRVAAFD